MPVRSWIHSFRVQNSNTLEDNSPFLCFTSEDYDVSKLSSKTLVVPIVSTANVSQLAVDILMETLSLSRIGIFDSRYHVPVVGGREHGEHGVTTPMELFGKEDVDFVVIQQRSPVLKAQKEAFVSALLRFIEDIGFNSVLFVTGVDPINRSDSQMHIPLFHLASPSLENTPIKLLTSLPKYTVNESVPNFPGAGLTRRIITSLSGSRISFGVLIWMGMEGDNQDDAKLVADVAAKILSVRGNVEGWKVPESWRQGLFGTPNDQTLFG